MPRTEMERLQGDAKIWVFAANRTLTAAESAELLSALDRFLDDWKAHEVPVTGARELRNDQFVIVAADAESYTSGCSIDRLFDLFQAAEKRFGVSFLDANLVFFRGQDGIRGVTRREFRQMAERGEIDGTTPVVDNTVETVEALRAGALEKPASHSWHGEAFGLR